MALFAGLFTGSSQAAPAAPSNPKAPFSGLFPTPTAPTTVPKQPVAPVSAPAPIAISNSTTSGIPASALKGSLGGGYGAAVDTDPYSGKPLLTYENQTAKASQLLSNRVASTFDPTVPQKIDPSFLHNDRMPEAASEAVRKATGAEPDEQLDHLISLELGGSNDTSNLNNEKLKSDGTQPSLTLENATAKMVANGQISYIDGQKIIARAKGVQLPDDQDFASSAHPLASAYPKPAPNQVGTQAQKPNIFEGLLTGKTTSGQPTLLAKAGNYIKDAFTNPGTTSKPLFDALGGEAVVHPIQTLHTIINNAKQGTDSTLENLASSAKTMVSGDQSVSQRTSSVLNFLTSAASTLFFPATETFNIASQLPIIKPAADATGLIFNKTGKVGGFAADKLLSVLPISSDAKANLSTAVHNVGTLAGQIILGGHIYGALTGAMDAKGEITPEQEQQVVADANDKVEQLNKASMPPTPKAPIESDPQAKRTILYHGTDSTSAESIRANGFREGRSEISPLASVRTPVHLTANFDDATTFAKARAQSNGGNPAILKVDASDANPQLGQDKVDYTIAEKDLGKLKILDGSGSEMAPEPKPQQQTPDLKTSGIAKSIEANAIAKGLTDKFENLAGFEGKNVKDQAAKVADLIANNQAKARDIVDGKVEVPTGMSVRMFMNGMEDFANKNNDTGLLNKLASSPLTAESSVHAQEMRFAQERDPESPVERIKSVREAREKAVQTKNGGKSVDVLRDTVKDDVSREIKKASARPRDWASFIEEIKC